MFTPESLPTRGVEIMKKHLAVEGKHVTVSLWDTVGQERFKALSKVYYKGATAALIVYDITDRHSFQEVPSWLHLLSTDSSTKPRPWTSKTWS